MGREIPDMDSSDAEGQFQETLFLKRVTGATGLTAAMTGTEVQQGSSNTTPSDASDAYREPYRTVHVRPAPLPPIPDAWRDSAVDID